jgi:hypothetical protein
MIRVVNIKTEEVQNVYYVGRPSALGNPYFIGKHGSRESVIEKYERHLDKALTRPGRIRDEFNDVLALARNGDVLLGCFCAPQACHADVIKRKIEERL